MSAGQPVFGSTTARLGLLPRLRAGSGTLQLFLPEWVYDLAVLAFYPLNWLIAAWAARCPRRYAAPDWSLDPGLKPERLPALGAGLASLRAAVARGDGQRFDDAEVWALFDALPAPSTNDMLGNWVGAVVPSGSVLDAALPLERLFSLLGLRWGKRYLTPHKGDPFILIAGDALVFPVPVWGNVSLPELSLRGKAGAVMVYDHQPWKDHFRVLDDGRGPGPRVLLGNWFSREKNGGWFTLTSRPALDAAVKDMLVRSPY